MVTLCCERARVIILSRSNFSILLGAMLASRRTRSAAAATQSVASLQRWLEDCMARRGNRDLHKCWRYFIELPWKNRADPKELAKMADLVLQLHSIICMRSLQTKLNCLHMRSFSLQF